jgi:hypothetical protein
MRTQCLKKTHPNGVHPQVIARLFRINLRTVFRLFKYGEIRQVGKSLLGDKEQILQILTNFHRTCGPTKVVRDLNITKGTIHAWKNKGILRATQVLGKTRYDLASVQSIRRLQEYRPGQKKVLLRTSTEIEDIRAKIEKLYNACTPEINRFAREQAKMDMGVFTRNFQRNDTVIRSRVVPKAEKEL